MWKVSKNCHNSRSTHFYTNPHILSSRYHVLHLLMPSFCWTSFSFHLCMLNFYILQIYEQSEFPVPSRTNLSCRRAGLPTLQRFRAVACSDFVIIEFKQQFCGNRQTHKPTKYCNPPLTRWGLTRILLKYECPKIILECVYTNQDLLCVILDLRRLTGLALLVLCPQERCVASSQSLWALDRDALSMASYTANGEEIQSTQTYIYIYIYIHTWSKAILGQPSWRALPTSWAERSNASVCWPLTL